MLVSLFDFIRDLAILAAAIGVARWAWMWPTEQAIRRDEEAKAAFEAERFRADARSWSTGIAAHAAAISGRLEALAADQARQREDDAQRHARDDWQREAATLQRAAEARAALKVRVHALLQSTTDPYLAFGEIEQALAADGSTGAAEDAADPPARSDAGATLPIGAGELRRALIELVGQSVVAQLDRDRYFIASDFEAGEGEG